MRQQNTCNARNDRDGGDASSSSVTPSLSSDELLLLAVRSWDPRHGFPLGFRLACLHAGAAAVLRSLDLFLTLLTQHAARPVNRCARTCTTVSEDEMLLLDLFSLAGRGRLLDARLALNGLVSSQHLGALLAAAGRCADALATVQRHVGALPDDRAATVPRPGAAHLAIIPGGAWAARPRTACTGTPGRLQRRGRPRRHPGPRKVVATPRSDNDHPDR